MDSANHCALFSFLFYTVSHCFLIGVLQLNNFLSDNFISLMLKCQLVGSYKMQVSDASMAANAGCNTQTTCASGLSSDLGSQKPNLPPYVTE